jgi:hypothetical protein
MAHTMLELDHGLAITRRENAAIAGVLNDTIVNQAIFDIDLDGCRVLRGSVRRARRDTT